MKYIQLTKDKQAKVDDEDFEFLNQWKWGITGPRKNYVARQTARPNRKVIYMHRAIINAPPGLEVDHINHDTFDNRKANLRLCTESQNAANSRKQKTTSSSKYKGVSIAQRGKITYWFVQIKVNYKNYRIGYFKNERHAAMAYDLWALHFFGKFALTNFKPIAHSDMSMRKQR